MNVKPSSLLESHDRIAALDLDAIKFKLIHDGSGKWNADRADAAECAYKKFLMLAAKFPEQRLVPTEEIDEIWHHHILDTRKYQRDCEYALGYFLHHWPYAGMMGSHDEAEFRANFERTCELHLSQFASRYSTGSAGTICDSCDTDATSETYERRRPQFLSA